MNKNDPQPEPEIQMTPVEFGPSQTEEEAIGTVIPAPRAPYQYSAFWPVLIILLTLIYSTVRDIVTLNRRIVTINSDDAPALEMLKRQGNQTDFIKAMQADLQALSPTDRVAAKLLSDFFPPPASQKDATPADSSKTPAK